MKALPTFLRLRWARIVLNVVLTGLLAALLTAVIVWTQFDVLWIAFLGGVLFAALAMLATQASKAHWLATRRTQQLERIRAQLRQEASRGRLAADAARIAESRLRVLANALPTLILFVDRDERCRYHNSAVEHTTGLHAERISGQTLREVMGVAYPSVAPHVADALRGRPASYEFAWTGAALPETYSARLVPYPPGDASPQGFFLLLAGAGSRPPERPVSSARRADEGASVGDVALAAEGGETLYLRSIAGELMGWDEPRVKLEYALKENQFLLFTQRMRPLKVRLPDPLCHEVLLRLREEEDNLLPPGGFIPVAERYGMMEELDRWVVRNLIAWCAAQRRGSSAWRPPLYCVNVSEATVCSQDFVRFVNAELRRHEFDARALCFEIGEPEILGQHAYVRPALHQRAETARLPVHRGRVRQREGVVHAPEGAGARLRQDRRRHHSEHAERSGRPRQDARDHHGVREGGTAHHRRVRRDRGDARQAARHRRRLRAGIRNRPARADRPNGATRGIRNGQRESRYFSRRASPS